MIDTTQCGAPGAMATEDYTALGRGRTGPLRRPPPQPRLAGAPERVAGLDAEGASWGRSMQVARTRGQDRGLGRSTGGWDRQGWELGKGRRLSATATGRQGHGKPQGWGEGQYSLVPHSVVPTQARVGRLPTSHPPALDTGAAVEETASAPHSANREKVRRFFVRSKY